MTHKLCASNPMTESRRQFVHGPLVTGVERVTRPYILSAYCIAITVGVCAYAFIGG
jgi:hypothetical protein